MLLNLQSTNPKVTSLRIKVNKSAKKRWHRLPTRADRAKVDKPQIFQWAGRSSGLVDIGLRIRVPPRIPDKDYVTESIRQDGYLNRIGMTIQRWFGKRIKPTGAEGEKKDHEPSADDLFDPMSSDEISGGQRILRRHRLRLSPEGLCTPHSLGARRSWASRRLGIDLGNTVSSAPDALVSNGD